MSKTHLRKRALKKPRQPKEEVYTERVRREWSPCRTGDAYYGVRVTDVPERVNCKNCLKMMEAEA